MNEHKDDIIMLVVLGMLVIILIAALVSDTISGTSSDNTITNSSSKHNHDHEKFLIKKKYFDRGCSGCRRKFQEHFENINDELYSPDIGWLSNNGLLPWWNSTRHTRNMSYDLRGDVVPYGVCTGGSFPWWKSPLTPPC